jgi:DNA-binding transcriptional LysR family regulator
MFLRQLDYLVALDRERHFGRAAAACHVSQPALSTAIRTLERELGVPLVRRGGRFEGFTDEGERVLVWARRALTDLQSLTQEIDRLRSGLEGTLRLGVIPTALPVTAHVTSRFRRRHPRMRVELVSMSSREIAQALANGEVDAGITYLDNEPLPDVEALELWRERYLLVSETELLPDDAATIAWASAATLPLCLLTEDMQHRRIVDAAFAAGGATPAPVVLTNSISALIAHARSGLAAVISHSWLTIHPLSADLRAIPLVDPVVAHGVGLVVAREARQTPVVSELLALFEPLELDERLRLPGAPVSPPGEPA